jgi:peptidoglycan-associated lipoprotein
MLGALLAGLVLGCGGKAKQAISEAEKAVTEAKQAEAPQYAADEFKSAEDNLTLAKDQLGKRKYKDSQTSALTARDQANLARDRALERKKTAEAKATEKKALGYNVPSLYGEEELAKAGAAPPKAATEASMEEQAKAALQDVHFELDASTLSEEARSLLSGNAAWLKQNPGVKVQIEGHCDERGAEEYNLALGQRRAQAVKEYMMSLGVDEARMKTISYGESLPLDPGHTEAAWAKNRRAHFALVP